MKTNKKLIRDMERGEFLSLLKELQVEHLEPKIRIIVEEVVKARGHSSPCTLLERHLDIERALFLKLEGIEKSLKEMRELLNVFRNTKGFVLGVKWLGGIVIGAAALWLAISTLFKGVKVP